MKKLIGSLMLSLMWCISIYAQNNTIEIVVVSDNEPLSGATVFIESLDKGAITNFDGIAVFSDIPDGTYEVQISFLGFEPVEVEVVVPQESPLVFNLEESENTLDAVVLQSSRGTRTIRKTPTRVEFIGSEELSEKAMMNPNSVSMVLRESTGIQMQQTSLSSGNTNIRIQGLDGRYTQLLRDGFPLYGGFSSGLSILQIPPLDLQQFEIIKGSSSTLYGGGAIAGLVNMVSKTPEDEPELQLMLSQTMAAGSTVNAFYSERYGKLGISLYGSGHYQKAYDPEDDDFSNLPETRSVSFNPKVFYYPSDATRLWLGLNGTYDNRLGGDMNAIEGEPNGIHQYTEENNSKRLSSQFEYRTELSPVNTLTVRNSISYFNRELTLPNLRFSGDQINSFSEATFQTFSKESDWIFGVNLYTVDFDEDDGEALQRDQQDVTFGAFGKNIYDLSDSWILETGFRLDHAKDWGTFALPRLSLLYKNDQGFSSRIGGGLGYKIPDIFTEEAERVNYENIMPIDTSTLEAERSYGGNIDFNYRSSLVTDIDVSINQLFYVTAIRDGLLLNPSEGNFLAFENADGTIVSKGAETNVKFSYKDFRWFLNYAYIDTRLNYLPTKPQKPLTARHNAGSVVMYEGSVWMLGFETFYTGQQLLPNGTKSRAYTLLGFLAMRNFDWGSVYVNFENFTDRRQSRYSPLVLPPHEDPVFPEIYAPTDGFILSAGIIIKPFGNEDEH
ncbi:TonB-dependent receptor [Constantimarinum furrinae]|uniref:TonB dependent/ligand-gated channel n=1 Tax=Constantimarinum furrinae TaxID=2562285 RepID=A0A7G8PWN3_9FLAO|nr:TonB-dependent receptor [Constantimarinum furrinae]QNJ98749.1 TonB dependent/ligand-gated channel [Constantimarinum furrinae]